MNRRFLALLASLALVLVACGADPVTETTTASTTVPTTTPTTEPEATGVRLTYAFAAGQTYFYEIEIDQTLEMSASGDLDAFDDGEEMPGSMDVRITGTGTVRYSVSDGPEPGTFEINIRGDFTDLTVTGTIDGEPIEDGEIPDMADMGPLDATVIVDENGRPIVDDSEMEDLFGGFFGGGMDNLGEMTGAFDFGFFGPPFEDGEVSVGDSWTHTIDIPGMGDEVFTTEVRSSVSGTETVDGTETFVIDTVTNTPLIEFDLAEFFIGMLESFLFMFGEPDDDELAEFLAVAEQIKFQFRIPASRTEAKVWFDAEAGMAVRGEVSGSGGLSFDMAVPDEDTGEIVEVSMTMSGSQSVNYRLVRTTGS